MTAAHAAEEAKSESADLDIPHWRTLKTDGYMKKEGFKVVIAGKRWRVDEYQTHLINEL